MPTIPLLLPSILAATVQEIGVPQGFTLLNQVPKIPTPSNSVTWDILIGSSNMARLNVPNSEANIVDRLGKKQATATCFNMREKKTFQPTTLYWLRAPGKIAATNAQAEVLREIADLNNRFDTRAEYSLWKMLSGTLVLDEAAVQATIDYQMQTTHKPFPAVTWATATPVQIIADIQAWQKLIRTDGNVNDEGIDVYVSRTVMNYVFNSFANTTYAPLLSDTLKNQFYTTGSMPGFLGLNWKIQEKTYTNDSGVTTPYLASKGLIMGNFTENNPLALLEGPCADHDALTLAPGAVYTGKFAKTWRDPDPSALQYLLDWSILPINYRPDQFIAVADVTATS